MLLLADRMVAAENDVKALKQEHAVKDAEINKLTNGLTIAFGGFFAHEVKINFEFCNGHLHILMLCDCIREENLKGGTDAFFKRFFLRGDIHMTPTLRGVWGGGGDKAKIRCYRR